MTNSGVPAAHSTRHERPRVGRRYTPERTDDRYDAIIIGSGTGGLACAASLANTGQRVLVLEQHSTIGGLTHTFERNGYEWCTGLHYVGDMAKGDQLRRIMDVVTGNELEWADMGEVYDRYIIAGETYDVLAGISNYKAEMLRRFPHELEAIDAYITRVKQTQAETINYFGQKLLPTPIQRLASKRLSPDVHRTTAEVLDEITDNKTLKSVLCAQWGGCGTPPGDMAFSMHAGAVASYFDGAYYPIGGGSRIAELAVGQIEASGGTVLSSALVDEILVSKNKVRGVRMTNGHNVLCPIVISAAGAFNTYQRLLKGSTADELADRTEKLGSSAAHIGIYLGFEETAEELDLPKFNLWIQPGFDHDANYEAFWQDPEAPFPLIFVTFPSAKDPDFDRRYPGRATIEIVVPTPFAHVAQWADSDRQQRPTDYIEFKARMEKRIMVAVEKALPQIVGKVAYSEISTPLTMNHFNRSTYGENYGLRHTPDRYRSSWLRPKTSVRGLYLTGQDAFTMGIAGATTAGMLTAIRILGPWKARKLLRAMGR